MILMIINKTHFQLTYPQPVRVLQTSSGVIRKYFERDALLSDRYDCPFVHVRIMDTHTAKDRERFDEILVVLGEG